MSPAITILVPNVASPELASSQNATAKSPILPNEDPAAYRAHNAAYLNRYSPAPMAALDVTCIDCVNELSGIRWRLARVPALEADLIALEVRELTTNSDHADTVAGLEIRQIEAIAFKRLVESRILTSLYNQEARLSRRAAKIRERLDANIQSSLRANAPSPTPPAPLSVQPQVQPIVPLRPECKNEPTSASAGHPVRVVKTGRNEPCPCGSGLKYKRCCLHHPAATLASAA